MFFANPIYFTAAVVLIVVGAWKRWLSAGEWVLCAALLLIPYVTKAHENCFAGMARFASVALPLYLVVGRLLAALPRPLGAALMCLFAFLLGAYAASFAAWHHFI